MKHLSLFSGIGGFDLAAEWVGFENVGQVEKDQFCLQVLKKNFPHVPKFKDIKKFGKTDLTGRVDIITGGFPCQPFSQAGARGGTSDARHLWPEMLRVIRAFKPSWVVAENVRGLLTIEEGLVFEQVCIDLENAGYEVQPIIIPAASVNAPHRRDRVWFIAHTINSRSRGEERGEFKKSDSLSGKNQQKNSTTRKLERADSNGETLQSTTNAKSERAREDKFNSWGINFGYSRRAAESATNTECKRYEGKEYKTRQNARYSGRSQWNKNWFEVATEFCEPYDGVSNWVGRYFKNILNIKDYGQTIKNHNRENLRILQKILLSQKIREELGRLYEVEQAEILLAFLCRIKGESHNSISVSRESKETSKNSMREVWYSAEARYSPQRWKYQKQLSEQLKNFMPQLPHEISLEIAKSWDCLWLAFSSSVIRPVELGEFKCSKARHRNEQIKAYGNAIVPQVAFEIFKAIKYTQSNK